MFRKMLIAVGIAGVLALGIIGCGDKNTTPPETTKERIERLTSKCFENIAEMYGGVEQARQDHALSVRIDRSCYKQYREGRLDYMDKEN